MRKIYRDCVLLVIISAIIGFTINIFHPDGYIFVLKSILRKQQAIVYIPTQEAKFKFDNNTALFIDTRSRYAYDDHHILNAINIPAYPQKECDLYISKNLNRINSDYEKVLYCDGMSCKSSYRVAGKILETGYNGTVYIIKDGFPGWQQKGFPVQK